jgi:mono/diheme cytochrome c family protein
MRLSSALLCCLLLAACEKAKQDMYDQPRYKPMARSELFQDGSSARPLPQGTVPHSMGAFSGTSSGRMGEDEVLRDRRAHEAAASPYPVDMQLLRRGQERYSIYCLPCHSPLGDGDGWIARRGFPAPPTYHSDRLRQAPDRHIYDVITNGYGIMFPYADRIDAPDRWAIVAYVRALQMSQNATLADVPPALRDKLRAAEPEGKR